jgi:tRNA-specific 2-thiouridylase
VSRLVAERAHFIAGDPPGEEMRVDARIRHNHAPAPATIRPLEAGRLAVAFDEPQRAAAPGQSVVFYQGDLVVGGGIIASR